MFYVQYLSSLCHRRQWPEPQYSNQLTRHGIKCVVRVNNREYHTDTAYESEVLASENAAMRAYLICRNFSVNDGMYPSGTTQQGQGGVLQGMPVAIGTERRNTYTEDGASVRGHGSRNGGSSGSVSSSGSRSDGSRSGGSSPGTYETRLALGERRNSRVVVYGGSRHR